MTTATTADSVARELGPGVEVGPYRIVDLIGRGGMGVVYEARHTRVGQRAALKLLAASRRRDVGTAAVRRFMTEVEALSRLDHPGLVRVLDCGEGEHGPWIAMEFVAGEVLRARLDRQAGAGERPATATALRTARRIASAVAAIHGVGIVHRDLKPDNIMIVPDDEVPGRERVKLLDFGIAKLTGGDSHQTTEGTVLGTAGYMAPEQCTGAGDIDDRADVYAVGVILFELLTGARPFAGPAADVMRQHLFVEPPLARLAELPDELRDVVRVMLAKEPSRRPAIAEVVRRLRALETPIAGVPEAEPAAASGHAETVPAVAVRTVPGKRARTRRRRPWLAAAALVGAGVAATAFTLTRPRDAPAAHALPGMVVVEGARFQMGSTRDELDAACAELPGGCLDVERPQLERELPARTVAVTTFQIDTREVSNRDYAEFLTVSMNLVAVRDDRDEHYPRFVVEDSTDLTLLDLYPRDGAALVRAADGSFTARPDRAALPVTQVTWDGASRYCRYLGKRLPTEAEWELAARGTARRRFPWGREAPGCDGVVFGRGEDRGCPDVPLRMEPVATAAQDVTPTGVHDLAGNVSEWVQDQFGLPYYGDCGECKDPIVEQTVPLAEDIRIVRGGSFRGLAWFSRTTTRSRWKRTEVMEGVGFRCATR